jgi:hypothetical protein
MPLQQIARRHQSGKIARACINVRDLAAAAAVKVMMMVLVDLVAIRLARQADHIHDTVRKQVFDVAVDRGQAEVGDCLLSLGQ